MEKPALIILYRLLTGISVVLLLVLVYLGYRILDISEETRAVQTRKLAYLERRLSKIESRVETLTLTIADSTRNFPPEGSAPSQDSSTRKSSGGIRTSVNENSAELENIKKILASTGLERLAEGDEIDPETFGSMYSDYAERNRVSQYRQSMMGKNESQHRQDESLFDVDLNELYNRARLRGGAGADSGDREAAFTEMLDKYPDAYATAMVITERAFAAMWSREQAGVEKYYTMLQEGDNNIANTVVTDRGIEAMPNIELYLVRQYLRNGREEEAGSLIESLESNYADSLVFSGRNNRGRRWMTVSEALDWINSNR